MRSVKIMKTAKISYVVMSLLFGVLGILLLIKPEIISPVFISILMQTGMRSPVFSFTIREQISERTRFFKY